LGRPAKSRNAIACLNQNALADLRALSKARGKDMVGELNATFFSVLPERIDLMNRALRDGDAPAFSAGAHKLRGGAACIGADRFAALCAKLESIGDAGSLDGAEPLIEELMRESENLREALASQGGRRISQP
jgi:HPt (histidine-containing phosphotransfer) domain-containing protein